MKSRALFWRYSRLSSSRWVIYDPIDWQSRIVHRIAHYLPRLWWGVKWDPRMLWVGVAWATGFSEWRHDLDVKICVLPCLPLCFSWRWSGITPYRPVEEIPF